MSSAGRRLSCEPLASSDHNQISAAIKLTGGAAAAAAAGRGANRMRRDESVRPHRPTGRLACARQVRARTATALIMCLTVMALVLATAIRQVAADSKATPAGKLAELTSKLGAGGSRLVRQLDLSQTGGHINEWLVHQVAPAVATKLIDNVLRLPPKAAGKNADGQQQQPGGKGALPIDTQALADKIVDKLADSIKRRKQPPAPAPLPVESEQRSNEKQQEQQPNEPPIKQRSRKGKSLVGDSVQQVVSSLFSRDQRKFFGRAMEKSRFPPLRAYVSSSPSTNSNHHQPQQQSNQYQASNQQPGEPNYQAGEQMFAASTDSSSSSQLDENPVVFRAEHGHNSSTVSTERPLPGQSAHNQQQQQHHLNSMLQNNFVQNQNLSPLISSLMSSTATNQLGHKLLQKHRHQQKYVHTNRHSSQHNQLAPKPWSPQSSSGGGGGGGGRRQQQSPYMSLPVTSDMNIVQAPSSPPPPVVAAHQQQPTFSTTQQPPSTSSSTTTTASSSSSTTTTANPVPPFSFVPPSHSINSIHLHQQQQQPQLVQANKFKINNRHQHPSASASSSWQHSRNPYYGQANNNHRYQHHYPSGSAISQAAAAASTSTSTTSTTTTTTTTTSTTTTTPEPPPPQTEPMMTETMDPGAIEDLDNQTSAPVSSILSSVAQSALESAFSHANSISNNNNNNHQEESQIYNTYANNSSSSSSSYSSNPTSTPPASSSSSASHMRGASPSSTSARHSILSAEAIPTALGAPLYHLNRANFTATSIMGPPPRRSGASPAAKAAAQYLQKGLTSISSTIFGRQNKSWARRLGLSSVLLSGLLYGAAIMANPGAPLPTNGLEVLQALTTKKRRKGSNLLPAVDTSKLAVPALTGPVNAALMDANSNLNILYQQPQLIPIIEHLIQQEQQQQQQNSLFSQRSNLSPSPIEIQSFDDQERAARRDSPSQYYTIQAIPRFISELGQGEPDRARSSQQQQQASIIRR